MLESTYFFDPKTIQRMELCVLATLNWRLRSVTPFDYIHYFISKFPSFAAQLNTIQSLASDLILNTTRVIDFLRFPPSVIAATAVISTTTGNLNLPETFDERVNRVSVGSILFRILLPAFVSVLGFNSPQFGKFSIVRQGVILVIIYLSLGDNYFRNWVTAVRIYSQVASPSDEPSGRVLYEYTFCIAIVLSHVAQSFRASVASLIPEARVSYQALQSCCELLVRLAEKLALSVMHLNFYPCEQDQEEI